ncbi:hypothetical protein ACHAXT_003926 [Thalassiosira profunda]
MEQTTLSIKPRAAARPSVPAEASAEEWRDDGSTRRGPRCETRQRVTRSREPSAIARKSKWLWPNALLFAMWLLVRSQRIRIEQDDHSIANPDNQTTAISTEYESPLAEQPAPTENVSDLSTKVNETTTPWTLDGKGRITVPKDMIMIRSSLLWCPNAKSGTTTVYDVLWKNKLMEGRCYRNCKHSAWKKVKTLPAESPKPVSFVIVRNPWDRLRSAYVDKIAPNPSKHEDKDGPITTFARFVAHAEKHRNSNMHWRLISERCWAGAEDGFQYDYILRLEDGDLNEKLREIFDRAGIELPAGIGKEVKNQKSTNHTSQALIDFYRKEAASANMTMEALVAQVGRIYKADIEPFGYSFPEY